MVDSDDDFHMGCWNIYLPAEILFRTSLAWTITSDGLLNKWSTAEPQVFKNYLDVHYFLCNFE